MQIRQLSIDYQEHEDRVLIRLAGTESEEVRIWLTRRLFERLLPPLQRSTTELEARLAAMSGRDTHTKQMLADIRRDESLQSTDFQTPYQNQATVFPVGETPLLVTKIDLSQRSNGRLRLGFEEQLAQAETPRQYGFELPPKLLHSVIHLMEKAGRRGGWLPNPGAAALDKPTTPSTPERPRFVN